MTLTPKQKIKLAIKVLNGELDETDLPLDVLTIQHQRPPKHHIRPADMKPGEGWLAYQNRKADENRRLQNRKD
jgi:hypothetical protein